MKRLLPLYLIMLVSLEGKAQTFTGRVTDRSGKPLVSASVVAKGDDSSVVAIVLKEVKVTPQRIREQGDTLTYSVESFKMKQDRQGKAINRFYIEGMDLLGGKYAMASENLSADKVKSVQVYENHQPVKALKDIKFSEQAALNLILKDEAKNVWQGVVDVATGYGDERPRVGEQSSGIWLRDARWLEMVFGRKKQSISMVKANNTGKDIEHEVTDLTQFDKTAPTEDGILGDISLGAPNLDARRSKFNDTYIAATPQRVEPRKRYIVDNLELINKLKNGQSYSVTSLFSYSYLPGTLLLANDSVQRLTQQMLYWKVYAYYQHSIKQAKVTWQAGFETKIQWLTLGERDRYSEYQPYYTDYISCQQGSGQFENTTGQTANIGLGYRNVMTGLFCSITSGYSHQRDAVICQSRIVNHVYIRQATDFRQNRETYSLSGSLGKSVFWAKLSMTLNGSCQSMTNALQSWNHEIRIGSCVN